RKFFRRWTNLRVRLGAEGCRAVYFRPAHFDFLLTKRISHDMDVVTHIHERVGHFPDTRSRAVIGRERTCSYHRDGIAFRTVRDVSYLGRRLSHVTILGDLRYGLTVLREIIRAGTPSTVQLLGTSAITKEFALTTTLSPMVTPPITLQPAPR